MKRPLRVSCYVPSFNAGDTTRGLEVARALVAKARSENRETEVTFICPPVAGPNFEAVIRREGFSIGYTAVPLSDQHIEDFMNADRTGEEFVPDLERAKLYVEKYMEDMRSRRPDLVINGCIPPAGVAARILNIPTVTYLPFPAYPPWVRRHLLKDVPDEFENKLTIRLPAALRRGLVRAVAPLATRKRFFTQPTLARAGRELGWREPSPGLFTMLKADVELVTDLPDFYQGQETGPRARITGPLFSHPRQIEIDPRVLEAFDPVKPNKVLVTMGRSGGQRFLLEAIRAVASTEYNSVVVVQPTICSIAEVRAQIQLPPNLYLTDSFIPAPQVTPLADVAIIHGGQGTVQTTIASGTPFVGVAMQAEQQANLDNFTARGAGIRISRSFWNVQTVASAVQRVLSDPNYKASAQRLAQRFSSIDGHARAGEAIWEMVRERGL